MKRVKKDEIVLKKHNVIYKLIDDLKEIVSSNIPEKEVEEIIGRLTLTNSILFHVLTVEVHFLTLNKKM